MDIQLSEHFNYRKLIRFTWPSVVMMIFTSIYSVVDGIFVSNFVGKTPFAAINLMMPLLMVLGAVGFMLGTGGSALVAKTLGYSIGSSPIVSYNYGSRNHAELQNMYRRSLHIVGSIGLLIFVLAQLLARPLASVFVGYDADLLSLTVHAFRIYQVSFLLAGFNLYASAFFTALNNGVVSAVISCTRTLVCETLAVILLPMVFGLEGIWYAITVAEVLALCLTAYYLHTLRPRYNY